MYKIVNTINGGKPAKKKRPCSTKKKTGKKKIIRVSTERNPNKKKNANKPCHPIF
jgi:hypothetical protein